MGDLGSIHELGRFPWRREGLPTPVFLPGESHGQRSLAGYRLCSCKESDTTEQLSTAQHKHSMDFPGGASGGESACQCRNWRFNPWVGKIPKRKTRQPTAVLLPRESHGQGSLQGYSPWGHTEWDTTEATKQPQQLRGKAQTAHNPGHYSGMNFQ